MTDKITEARPFDWRLPSCAALVAFAVSISIALCQADTALSLYLFLVGPILIVLSWKQRVPAESTQLAW